MRLSRLLLRVCCLLLLAVPAFAGDGASSEDGASAKVIWTFEKGAVVQALDVTEMDPALRAALLVQMKDQGWTLATPKKEPKLAPTPTKKPKVVPAPQPTPKDDMERDIAELIRRGGTLPKGWRPHGLRPKPPAARVEKRSAAPGRSLAQVVGALMLRSIETKADPVRGPVYEAMLRDIARTMSTAGLAGLHAMLPRLKRQAEAGAREPKLGPAYREILETLGTAGNGQGALRPGVRLRWPSHAPLVTPAPPVAPRPPAAPKPPVASEPPFRGPFDGAPTTLGGAPLSYIIRSSAPRGGSPAAMLLNIGVVPEGSTAAAAGLLDGDRIIQIDGKPVTEASMKRAARVFREGGKLKLLVMRRDDKRETLDLEFEKE